MGFQRISIKSLVENIGSAHGRFQPLHKEHLEYLLEAKKRCRFLWIGITQYNIKNLSSSPNGRHRELPFNNPLTYFERVEMITSALIDEGITSNEFGMIPFPIETPELLPDFLPTNIPIYTTICEEWNQHKIAVLANVGYKVIVLWERKGKLFEGASIRLGISHGDNAWENAVPAATKKIIAKYSVHTRLK